MPVTSARIRATIKYREKSLDRIEIQTQKRLAIPARIAAAVEAGRAASRQDYIIRAITEALDRDGIPEAQHLDDDKTPEA